MFVPKMSNEKFFISFSVVSGSDPDFRLFITGFVLGLDPSTTGFTSATVIIAVDELVIPNALALKKQNAWKKPGIGSSSGEKLPKKKTFMSARTMIRFCKSIGTSDT